MREQSLSVIVDQYNNVLSELLDKHAPLQQKWLTIRLDAPLMNDSAMKERRQVERRWRLSRLTIDREMFIKEREQVKKVLYISISMLANSTTSLVIQEPFSRQFNRGSWWSALLTTLDNCLIVSAIISLNKLFDVILMTRIDPQLCARMSPAVSRRVYQTSCPPQRMKSAKRPANHTN